MDTPDVEQSKVENVDSNLVDGKWWHRAIAVVAGALGALVVPIFWALIALAEGKTCFPYAFGGFLISSSDPEHSFVSMFLFLFWITVGATGGSIGLKRGLLSSVVLGLGLALPFQLGWHYINCILR